ncbi:MAG: hypothetical protein HON14_04920 [Rhodospirillaceae bacterium]|jgi:hypothetical protein|nr:hypothetical protein [Rhodospirillaceae bacterium]MBT4587997.1 hypothetical protein [Rhodospirillaceae bacterium]MBT4938454.1 hypothetical protein [Rhodospirillaceae bacterium]MBT7267086.1 hypothetical protein [Rhodospirillaceae bacterium]
MPDSADISSEDTPEYLSFKTQVKGTNIIEQTLLATDYLNHFNEIVMLLEMVPDMPEIIEEAKAWAPKSYPDHFRDSTFSDKDLAVAAYEHVPERYKKPFEQTISQIDRLIEAAVRRLEEVSAMDDIEHLRVTSTDYSRNIQRLMDFASGIIHGSQNTMDQNEIDHLLSD